jgi:hypothetical protein
MLLLCSLTTEPGLYTTDKYSHLLINIIAYEYEKKKLRLVRPFCRQKYIFRIIIIYSIYKMEPLAPQLPQAIEAQ